MQYVKPTWQYHHKESSIRLVAATHMLDLASNLHFSPNQIKHPSHNSASHPIPQAKRQRSSICSSPGVQAD